MKTKKNYKDQNSLSRYYIIKEGIFKNKKKLINMYKESLVIYDVEETSKEEIYYDNIISIFTEENTKEFTIKYKDYTLEKQSNINTINDKSFNVATNFNKDKVNNLNNKTKNKDLLIDSTIYQSISYSVVSNNIKSLIINDILKNIDTLNKSKDPSKFSNACILSNIKKFNCYMFLNSNIKTCFNINKENGKLILSNNKLSNNSFVLDINLSIYNSMIEWVSSNDTNKSNREIRVKFTEINSIVLLYNFIIKIELINNSDIFFVAKSYEHMLDISISIIERSKKYIYYSILLDSSVLDNADFTNTLNSFNNNNNNSSTLNSSLINDTNLLLNYNNYNPSDPYNMYQNLKKADIIGQFELYRVLYYSSKQQVILCIDKEFIYELTFEDKQYLSNTNVSNTSNIINNIGMQKININPNTLNHPSNQNNNNINIINNNNNQNISNSNILTNKESSNLKCIKFIKISLSSILFIVPYSTINSTDVFEIILSNHSRYYYKCSKKDRNEITTIILNQYNNMQRIEINNSNNNQDKIDSNCKDDCKNKNINNIKNTDNKMASIFSRPIILLNTKPKIENRIIGFSYNSNKNDSEYEKFILKKLLQTFVVDDNCTHNQENIDNKTNSNKNINNLILSNNLNNLYYSHLTKEQIIEEICLNFCFNMYHFKNEINSNSNVYKNAIINIYECLNKEIIKLENLSIDNNFLEKSTNNNINNVITYTNNSNVSIPNNNLCYNSNAFHNRSLTKSSSLSNLSENKINSSTSNNNAILFTANKLTSEEELEVKKTKLIYTINLYLVLSKNLLVNFNCEKLLKIVLSSCKKPISQTLFYNSLCIIKELLPIINDNNQIQEYQPFKKEEIAQKKWLISTYLEDGYLLKELIIKILINIKEIDNISNTISVNNKNNLSPVLDNNNLQNINTNTVKFNNQNCSLEKNENRYSIINELWEEKDILKISIIFEVIKNLYSFSCSLSNLVKVIHLKEFISFDFLFLSTILLKSSSNILKIIAIDLLLNLLTNLNYDQEFKFKQTILSETLIFFIVLNLYINTNCEEISKLSLKFLKIFLISHVEAANLLLNLFPKPFFFLANTVGKLKISKNSNQNNVFNSSKFNAIRHIDYSYGNQKLKDNPHQAQAIINKPNPINWLDHEWNTFFGNIHKNFYTVKLIWNEHTRNEITNYLSNYINNYWEFSNDGKVIKSMFLGNSDSIGINNVNSINEDQSFDENKDLINKENNNNNSPRYSKSINYINNDLKNQEIKVNKNNLDFNSNSLLSKSINNKLDNKYENIIPSLNNINNSFFCVNYKELKKSDSYACLDNYYLVYKYYLKVLIQEDSGLPSLTEDIEDPLKFWDKLIQELLLTDSFNTEKIILIIKCLCLIYRDYSDVIGCFKYYNYFLSIFSQKNEKSEINEFIIQLILTSLQPVDKDLKKKNIEIFIDSEFISKEILFKYVDYLLFNNDKFLYKNCININDKEFYEEHTAKFKWNDKFFNNFSGGGMLNLPCKINIEGNLVDTNNVMNFNDDNLNNFNISNNKEFNSLSQSNNSSVFVLHESDFNMMNFLDNKKLIVKNLCNNFQYDKIYNNFTSYQYIHDSYNKGDKTIKCLTLIIRIYKILLKRFKLISDSLSKIYYPISRIKLLFLKKENFYKVIFVLFINNTNLVLETLDLLLNYLNDPLIYKEVIHSTNLSNVLVFYLIKFKSKNIMKFLDNMNYYNKIFFLNSSKLINYNNNNLGNNNINNKEDIMIINQQLNKNPINKQSNSKNVANRNNEMSLESVNNYSSAIPKLNIDEQAFFRLYTEFNIILVKYFPISLIYHYMKTDFSEFLRILFSNDKNEISLVCSTYSVLNNSEQALQWNRSMLKTLVETLVSDMRKFLAGEFAKNLRLLSYSSEINSKFNVYSCSVYSFNKDFKLNYENENNKMKCLIYYIKEIESINIKDIESNILTKNKYLENKNNDYMIGFEFGEYIKNFIKNLDDYHVESCIKIICDKIKDLMGRNENYYMKAKIINEIKSYLFFMKLVICKNLHIIKEENNLLLNIIIDITNNYNIENSDNDKNNLIRLIIDIVIVSFNNLNSYNEDNLDYFNSKLNLLILVKRWYVNCIYKHSLSNKVKNNQDNKNIIITHNPSDYECEFDIDITSETNNLRTKKISNKSLKNNIIINKENNDNSEFIKIEQELITNKFQEFKRHNSGPNIKDSSSCKYYESTSDDIKKNSLLNCSESKNLNDNEIKIVKINIIAILKTINFIVIESKFNTLVKNSLTKLIDFSFFCDIHRLFNCIVLSKTRDDMFNLSNFDIDLILQTFYTIELLSSINETCLKIVYSGLYIELLVFCFMFKDNNKDNLMKNKELNNNNNINYNTKKTDNTNNEVKMYGIYNIKIDKSKSDSNNIATEGNKDNNINMYNNSFKDDLEATKSKSIFNIQNNFSFNYLLKNKHTSQNIFKEIEENNTNFEDYKLKVNNFLAINSSRVLSIVKYNLYLLNESKFCGQIKFEKNENNIIDLFNKTLKRILPSIFIDMFSTIYERIYLNEIVENHKNTNNTNLDNKTSKEKAYNNKFNKNNYINKKTDIENYQDNVFSLEKNIKVEDNSNNNKTYINKKYIDNEEITFNQEKTFLKNLKSDFEEPDFIWDKKLRKEALLFLFNILEDINFYLIHNNFVDNNTKTFSSENIDNNKKILLNNSYNDDKITNNFSDNKLNIIQKNTFLTVSYKSKDEIRLSQKRLSSDFNKATNNTTSAKVSNLNSKICPQDFDINTLDNNTDYELNSCYKNNVFPVLEENFYFLIKEMASFEYKSYSNELKIENIYIKIYNKKPEFKIVNYNKFIESLKLEIINSTNEYSFEKLDNLLLALNNCLQYHSKADDKLLVSDNSFIKKFSDILESKKLYSGSIELLYTFSYKSNFTINFLFNKLNLFYILNKIVDNNTILSISSIIKMLFSFSKNASCYDNINLSIFLFLLKKIIITRKIKDNCPYSIPILSRKLNLDLNYLNTISEEKLNTDFDKRPSIDYLNKLTNGLSKNSINKLTNELKNLKKSSSIDIINNNLNNITNKFKHSEINHSKDSNNIIDNENYIKESLINDNNENDEEKLENSIRLEILKLFKSYFRIDNISAKLRSIIDMYLPPKITDNIFSAKDLAIESLQWIDNNYEYPDLIWNNDSIRKSLFLIIEDCKFIIQDLNNIENFPQSLLKYKIDRYQQFLFEVSQEYIIDNIYVRIFNRNPSYNINKSLILFMKNIHNSFLTSFCNYSVSNFILKRHYLEQFKNDSRDNNYDNKKKNELNKSNDYISDILNIKFNSYYKLSDNEIEMIKILEKVFYSKTIIVLTALLLCLEQIISNDFNENLLIASNDYLNSIDKTLIKDESEKQIINFLQRTIDNKILLNNNYIKNLIEFIGLILYNNTYKSVNSIIRILLLQILYLLLNNKEYIKYFENINIIEIIDISLDNYSNLYSRKNSNISNAEGVDILDSKLFIKDDACICMLIYLF